MTNMSLGTSSQCKTNHISHSCVSTAVFLVLVRVVWLSSTCIVLFLSASSVSAIPYPELWAAVFFFPVRQSQLPEIIKTQSFYKKNNRIIK